MHETSLHRARLMSSVAATAISLACGTNYVYSAWAPQFADKLQLTATQSNMVGIAGNLGMYSMGVPVGYVIDTRGPRPPVIVGSVLLGAGYLMLQRMYAAGAAEGGVGAEGAGAGSVAAMCLYSYLTGLGGCMAFASAVKTSALNWPHHRGTATAFPLAAFGLSAFFFAVFGTLLVPGDTHGFLLLLAVGTFVLTFVGFFFLRVLPHAHSSYHALPPPLSGDAGPDADESANLADSQQLRRTLSEEDKRRMRSTRRHPVAAHPDDIGRSPPSAPGEHGNAGDDEQEDEGVGGGEPAAASTAAAAAATPSTSSHPSAPLLADADPDNTDETSSLISRASSLPGDVLVQSSVDLDRSHRVDIRGWKLLKNIEFWQFFCIMGILAGIGLMSINNIGHDANALWKRYDDSVDETFLIGRQQMHVSILSIGSFCGRLLSGVGSDFLVKSLHASRVWCLVVASVIFTGAQICALNITNPHLLGLVSAFSGLGYGFLFGVFPSIVAETFGIHGLSQNWGFMTLSPVVSGNVFNLFYGAVFDRHTVVGPSGERWCPDGIDCYRAAYVVTLAACGLGMVVTLLVIRHQYLQRLKEAGKRSLED